mgnify:FL=1
MAFKLGFIGAGAMAEAILKGVLQAKLYQPQEMLISDINLVRLKELHQNLGVAIAANNKEVINECPIILLAVKPQQISEVLSQEKESIILGKVLISIAAGIKTESIEKIVGNISVIRVMPNTPALVGAGMSALCKGLYAKEEDLNVATDIFASVGETVVVEEKLMDAVTAVSGSGPAYAYQFIEAMADGGVQVGLPRPIAYKLAAQTMIGAGLMVLETGMHPGHLKDMVTSPGGTTIKAVNVLEKAGVRGTIMDAVEAAYLWSQKLGNEKN